jgi:hypothetical protein
VLWRAFSISLFFSLLLLHCQSYVFSFHIEKQESHFAIAFPVECIPVVHSTPKTNKQTKELAEEQ